MSIEVIGKAYRLSIAVGTREVILFVDAEEGRQLQVGDSVELSSEVFKASIRKL